MVRSCFVPSAGSMQELARSCRRCGRGVHLLNPFPIHQITYNCSTMSEVRISSNLTPHRLGLGVLLLLAGCSDGLGPLVPCGEDQEVEITVSSEPIPVFSWKPACGFASLQVWDQNLASWVLYTHSRSAENPLRSGIRYGNAPPEAIGPGPAAPLVSGRSYTVWVYRWFGDANGGAHVPVGAATFQR